MKDNRLIRDDEDEALAPPESPKPQPLSREATKPVNKRRGGPYPGRRQVTAHIERELFLWLKAISAQTDKPMIQLMEEALREYVQRHAAQMKFGG